MYKPTSALDRATKLLAETTIDSRLVTQLNDQKMMINEPNFNLTVFANEDEYMLYARTGVFLLNSSMPKEHVNELLEKLMKKLSDTTDPSDRALQHTFLGLFVNGVTNGTLTAVEAYQWWQCTNTLGYVSGRYCQNQAIIQVGAVSKSPQELQKRALNYFKLLSEQAFAPAKFSLGQIFINQFLQKIDNNAAKPYHLLNGICHMMAVENNDATALFVFSQVPATDLIKAMVWSANQGDAAQINAVIVLFEAAEYQNIPEAMYFRATLSCWLETKLGEALAHKWKMPFNFPASKFILDNDKKSRLLLNAVQLAKNETTVTQSIKLLEHITCSASSQKQRASYHLFKIYSLGVPPFITRDETKASGYLLQSSAPFKIRTLSLLAKDLQQRENYIDNAIKLSSCNKKTTVYLDINDQWENAYQLFLVACQQTYATKLITDLAQEIPKIRTSITGQALQSVAQSISWSFDNDKETNFQKNFDSTVLDNCAAQKRRFESALQSPVNLNAWLILCEEKAEEILLTYDSSSESLIILNYVIGFWLVLLGHAAEHGIHREKNLDTARQLYTQAETMYDIHAKALRGLLQLKIHPAASLGYKHAVAELIELETHQSIYVLQIALGKVHCTPDFYQHAGWFQKTAILDKGINYFCKALDNAYCLHSKEIAVQDLFTAVPLDKLVDYFFTAAKSITAELQKNIKSSDENYADAASNCVIAKTLKYAAERALPAATYCRAEVSRLVIAHLGYNSECILGKDAKNGYLLINDADTINALRDIAGNTTTPPQVAHAALTSLAAYECDNHKVGKLNVLFEFVQQQNFSTSTDEVKNLVEKITAPVLTLINFLGTQQETQPFFAKQGSSSSSTSSTTIVTTATETSAPVPQNGVVRTHARSPVAQALTTTNSSFAGVQSTTTANDITTPTNAASL